MTDEPKPMGSIADEFRRLWNIPAGKVAPAPEFDLKAYVRSQRLETFKRLCPEEFTPKIDRSKIKNLSAWDQADKWDGSYPGVWLWSHESGEAKTRMLWRKFGQFHVEKGLTVQRITGLNLAEEYHDCYQNNRTAQFYRHMNGCQVVMLDDLEKMPLPAEGLGFSMQDQAARNARMLRELFDTFYEDHTRVLVTANEPIAWFAERIGPSAERRMRAVCSEIEF